MNTDIRQGLWIQLRGRAKVLWARITGNADLEAEGNADVMAGSLQESFGVAKKHAAREVTRGIDAFAAIAKRTARAIGR